MRTAIVVTVFCLLCTASIAGENSCSIVSMEFSDAKLRELASLPVGLSVANSPEVALATWNGAAKTSCKWTYETTVSALSESVTIEEFGAFGWNGSRWVFMNVTGAPFTANDFAEWYSCPGAKVIPGKSFRDPSNWSTDSKLRVGKTLWYFIGTNSTGKRVKGEGTVEEAAEFVATSK